MTSNLMMKFSRQSWYRTALSVLLIMCMVTSMMIMTVEDAHASVTLTGLACSAVVGLTIGALLGSSGVPMTEENSVSLINAFYWGCDAEQLAIIESFNPGQAIGDLFDAVSGFFTTHLNTGNLFYSRDASESICFPSMYMRNSKLYFTNGNPEFYPSGDSDYSLFGLPISWGSVVAESGSQGDMLTGNIYVTDEQGVKHLLWSGYGGMIVQEVRYSSSSDMFRSSVSLPSPDGTAGASIIYVYNPELGQDSIWPDSLYYYFQALMNDSLSSNDYIGVSTPISEYLPTSTDTEKALVTTTPVYVPQTWEQLWDSTPEIVRTGTFTDVGTGGGEVVDPGGTTDPDNPDDDTDIVVGDATGTITGDGTGTGIFEGLGNFVLKLPLLSQIVTFIQNIIHLITSGNSIITSIQGVLQSISQSITGIPQTLSNVWTSVKELLSPVTGILSGVQSLVTSVGALASGEVPAELQDRIYQFSGQLFDLLSWDELSQSMAALENFGSGYGEPPVISVNLHNLLEPAQNIGSFRNGFDNTETAVIDFKILEDERFGFMGMTLIELIRMMAAISMLWYTGWYVWGKIVPDEVVK